MDQDTIMTVPERPASPVSWIYSLTKPMLESMLAALYLESTGTVDELRKRLSTYLKSRPQESSRSGESSSTSTQETRHAPIDSSTVCEIVRKWGIQFGGDSDAVSFLERLSELQECYKLSGNDLLASLPQLFKGNALLWYRNTRNSWSKWEDFIRDFKMQYVHPRYDRHIEDEVRNRLQKPQESFREYFTNISTLLRRGKTVTETEKLDRIYDNMLPEFKLYVRRNTVNSITELTREATEYELIVEEQRKACSKPRHDYAPSNQSYRDLKNSSVRQSIPRHVATASTSNVQQTPGARNTQSSPTVRSQYTPGTHWSNPDKRCWRCGREGHRQQGCTGARILFCSRCGKKNIRSKDCRCPGNDNAVAPRG